jgi:hypothetical protein
MVVLTLQRAPEPFCGRKHFQTARLILVLAFANPAATYGQNSLSPIGPKPTPPDDDELAAQSAAYQVLQTSSIYSQGLHYFDVNISASCH